MNISLTFIYNRVAFEFVDSLFKFLRFSPLHTPYLKINQKLEVK